MISTDINLLFNDFFALLRNFLILYLGLHMTLTCNATKLNRTCIVLYKELNQINKHIVKTKTSKAEPFHTIFTMGIHVLTRAYKNINRYFIVIDKRTKLMTSQYFIIILFFYFKRIYQIHVTHVLSSKLFKCSQNN